MLKRTFATCVILGSIAFSSVTMAANLEQNMITIATNYKAFNSSSTPAEANKALDQMRAAGLDSKKSTPMKLIGKADNSPEMKGYRAGLDSLVAEIDKTKALVNAGKLDQAKVEGKKLIAIRDQGHKLYK